jgi:oligosaccharide reducing-end xylanase
MRPRGQDSHRDAGPRVGHVCARAFLMALALGLIGSCTTTADPIGYNAGPGVPLRHLTGPPSPYPTPFRDRGHIDAEITAKINNAFMQLFHGTGADQPIYYSDGVDGAGNPIAHIQDVFHVDTRTEGIGLGMLIAVELDHRPELDSLWTFAKESLRVQSGSASGYFTSFCENAAVMTMTCLDPFGLQQMTMALILAHDRYTLAGAPRGPVDYATDARDLLTLMRHKVDENGGVKDGVTDTFDHATSLVFDFPNTSGAAVGRPSIEMPGYYDLWAQATGDPFWTMAARAARDYWRRSADPKTGLLPLSARFADGMPVAGLDLFQSEAYRAQIAMALDQIWTDGDGWSAGEADRLLAFFTMQGPNYGMSFTLGGTTVNPQHDPALVATNGVSAAIASATPAPQRAAFVDAVWNMPIPTGITRYFSGLMYLLSLLVLGGHMQVL